MIPRITLSAAFAAAICAGSAATTALAGVVFHTGNQQYTNVNFAADTHGLVVEGEVDSTGISVFFRGFNASFDQSSAIELHGQHGVAFVERQHAADTLYRLSITAESGYGFRNMDWKLDAMPPVDGSVTFAAYDASGALIPVAGLNTFDFDHNGQNPFNAHVETSPGTLISMLTITSTVPIEDIKQVSVDAVLIPLPTSAVMGLASLAGLGGLMTLRNRRLQRS